MDDSDSDNTSVIRMKRDLDTFLSGSRRPFEDQKSYKMKRLQDDISFRKAPVQSFKFIPVEKGNESILSAQITSAKLSASIAETTTKRVKLELENEIESLKDEKRQMSDQIENLRAKLLFLSDKEKGTREQLKECMEEMDLNKSSHNKKIISEERQRLLLEEELNECKDKVTNLNFELRDAKYEIEMLKTKAYETQAKLEFELDNSQENLRDELEKYRKQATQAELTVRELENQLEEYKDEMAYTKACKVKIEKFPELEKQIEKLTAENEQFRHDEVNVMKMEEKIEGLQKKLARSEERVKELNQRDVSMTSDDPSARWVACKMCGSRQSQTTVDLVKQIQELKALQISQVEKQGEINSKLRTSEESLREFRARYEKAQESLDKTVLSCQSQADLIKRLQRKLLLITKEREGYKKILESYESEVTLNLNAAGQSTAPTQPLEDLIKSYQKQCESLEKENHQKAEQISLLKNEMSQLKNTSAVDKAPVSLKSDVDQILELKENVISLESKLQKSEEENNVLKARIEQRHLQGDYDPSKTKILHFTMNPAAQAQKKHEDSIDTLREENEKLRQRLEIVENSKGQVEDLTLQVEEKLQQPSSSRQVEEMQALVKKEELKNKRLIEAFKKTSQEFREVCCRMLGFKIDISSNSQYRLTSIYSESNKDYLMFQQSSSGDIQMLETDFSETVKDLIDIYLVKQDSVPAFLSSITLDLFSRQTMNIG